MAKSCWCSPSGIDTPLGVIEIEFRVGDTTATVIMPLTVFKKALIVAAPSAFPVASPLLLTATIPLGLALQVTDADISCVLASL